jgi:hypothetical protein
MHRLISDQAHPDVRRRGQWVLPRPKAMTPRPIRGSYPSPGDESRVFHRAWALPNHSTGGPLTRRWQSMNESKGVELDTMHLNTGTVDPGRF